MKRMLLIPKPHFLIYIFAISNGFVSSKIYGKRDYFDYLDVDIVNFPFLDGAFPVLPLTVFTFLNLFYLLECLAM